ncbi:unnamed protein product, partial [marine sediment metagenome]
NQNIGFKICCLEHLNFIHLNLPAPLDKTISQR